MQRTLSNWQRAGFIFTTIAGTLLHFLYDWSSQSVFVAPFSAINESSWEHMKLLFVPMFIFALIERQFLSEHYEKFWCIKLAGIGLGLTLIPVLYYSYTGIFGTSKDWINISIFFIAAAAAYLLETWLFKQDRGLCFTSLFALFLLCVIAFAFVVFTFLPPEIPLFQDPRVGVSFHEPWSCVNKKIP